MVGELRPFVDLPHELSLKALGARLFSRVEEEADGMRSPYLLRGAIDSSTEKIDPGRLPLSDVVLVRGATGSP